MWHEDMLWGHTLRSTVAHAEIRSIDTSEALALPGVYAVLTYDDLPTEVRNYGLEIQDTPVLAHGKVRHHGEPVAIVAADHPETARRAAARSGSTTPNSPSSPTRPRPPRPARRSSTRAATIAPKDPRQAPVQGDPLPRSCPAPEHRPPPAHSSAATRPRRAERADVIVTGDYVFGMQDQAFLGPESGLAVPAEDGGVDLYVATQWLHSDLRQMAPVLGLPENKVRMTLSGVGGAFGGREDLSMQIHACLLALRTGKPVKIVYNRFESFFGHVHRHPAKLHYEHGATRDGKLTHMRCRIVLDGGAYASTSPAVVATPPPSPSARTSSRTSTSRRSRSTATTRPAGRCAASARSRRASRTRRRWTSWRRCWGWTRWSSGSSTPWSRAPCCRRDSGSTRPRRSPNCCAASRRGRCRRAAVAHRGRGGRPQGAARRPLQHHARRRGRPGRRVRVGIKNVGFSEGFDDYSTARVRLEVIAGEAVAVVHTAMAEVGQGGVTVHAQIARSELGVTQVTIQPADTQVGSAGSTSASRQTYVTGGAVKEHL